MGVPVRAMRMAGMTVVMIDRLAMIMGFGMIVGFAVPAVPAWPRMGVVVMVVADRILSVPLVHPPDVP